MELDRDVLLLGLLLFGGLLVISSLVLVIWRRGESGELEVTIPIIEKAVKVKSFSMATLALGAAFVAWPVYELIREDRNVVQLGIVRTMESLPPNPTWAKNEPKDQALRKMGGWYLAFFESTRIEIDLGTSDGVQRNDYFATIYNPERAKNLPKTDIGNLQDELTSLIRVVSAYRDTSVCKLEEWAYDAHLERLKIDVVAERGEVIEMAPFAPVVVDQRVVAVPREEKVAKDNIDEYVADASQASGELRSKLYGRAIEQIDDFLLDYPTGFYRGTVLFDKAVVQFELGRYDEAIDGFENFRDRFPFHPSARAALDWIDRARAKERSND